jgi:hypothetical protein
VGTMARREAIATCLWATGYCASTESQSSSIARSISDQDWAVSLGAVGRLLPRSVDNRCPLHQSLVKARPRDAEMFLTGIDFSSPFSFCGASRVNFLAK